MSQPIDKNYLTNFVSDEIQGNLVLLKTLLGHFQTHLNEFIEVSNINQPQLEKVRASSHKLKSSCHSLGALNLAEDLKQLELEISKEDLQKVEVLTNKCCEDAKIVLSEIDIVKNEYGISD